MATIFSMPKLGMDMEEGTVVRWLKKEGDPVEKGEALAEIETDKSSVEVESPAFGIVLGILHPEGERLPVGRPLAVIGLAGEAIPDCAGAPAAPIPQEEPAFGALPAPPRPRISPRARRLADRQQVDIGRINATGPAGRIVERDVRAYLQAAAKTGQPCAGAPETDRTAPAASADAGLSGRAPAGALQADRVVPMSGIRGIVAARMLQSLGEMAQANHKMEADMTNLTALRAQLNSQSERGGPRISFTDLFVAICGRALQLCPDANSTLREDGIHRLRSVNIGVAAATDRGLVVPVIHNVTDMTLSGIAAAREELVGRALDGSLPPDAMKGGTFTISNLGMYGVDSFTAIINPPECCILAVGRIAQRPVVADGQIVVRPMMTLSLTYDHRILDGAPAAVFLQTIQRLIENPGLLLL
jgi:pyruvate dehydrogenase E2 component (dihydrolipoamide acetyltransferase)